jgi:uncharacterized protein (TIGR02996 family)
MTAQMGDRIFYRGQEHILFSCPLESYADADHPLPRFVSPHTANWRGYVASWSVEDDTLLLTDITAWVEGYQQVGWEHVFPHLRPPIPAEWFTGDLRIPQGEQLQYVHMGFASTYAQDLILAIYRAKVVLADLYENAIDTGGWWGRGQRIRSDLITRPAGLFTDEEWGFVLAVRAEPSAPEEWLVYSDWLTDQGDVRGDYLRLRVPLFGLSDADLQAHPSAGQLAQVERQHLMGSAWWLRLIGLVPVSDELLGGPVNAFHDWLLAARLRRDR